MASYIYVGNWGFHGNDHGISVFAYETQTGEMTFVERTHPEISVGMILVDPEQEVLYCIDERDTYPGMTSGGGGQVVAFRIEPDTGRLTEINRQPSFAPCPSFLELDREKKYLLVTNHSGNTPVTKSVKDAFGKYHITLEYDDASTVLYPIMRGGAIGDAVDIYKHSGKGVLPSQQNPHLHCVRRAPCGDLFAVTDKGSDSVYLFRIDRETSQLVLMNRRRAVPGSAPRYCVFHPTLPLLYVNHESKHLVSVYRYDGTGALELVENVNIFPASGFGSEDPSLKTEQSDLCIDASGSHIYGLIRGINAVYVLKVDETNGTLTKQQDLALEGDGPRAFRLSPDGRFLFVAMMRSGKVLVYSVSEDGTLRFTGRSCEEPHPGCFGFFVK